jgi:hypothetical protein
MASKKSAGSSRSASPAKKSAAKKAATAKTAKLSIELSSAEQQQAIACLQKSGKISFTLGHDQLLAIPQKRRIISRDCSWLID